MVPCVALIVPPVTVREPEPVMDPPLMVRRLPPAKVVPEMIRFPPETSTLAVPEIKEAVPELTTCCA